MFVHLQIMVFCASNLQGRAAAMAIRTYRSAAYDTIDQLRDNHHLEQPSPTYPLLLVRADVLFSARS